MCECGHGYVRYQEPIQLPDAAERYSARGFTGTAGGGDGGLAGAATSGGAASLADGAAGGSTFDE